VPNTIIDNGDIEIVIIDDDEHVRVNTLDLLSTVFNKISTYESPKKLKSQIELGAPMVILTDLRMPDADGFEFAKEVLSIDKDIPIILMTGYGDVSLAVEAMKYGVYDFIEKPFDTDYLIETLKRAIEKRSLVLNLSNTRQELSNLTAIESKIIGECPAMKGLKQQIVGLAPMDIPVLIYGSTGVGKELVARSLHEYSDRKNGAFVALNCAAIPEQLAEAELFGYDKGAFTDAVVARVGKLKHADGGVLFLDEVESLPLTTQAKLLRAISDGKVTPLGSNQEINFDCRIISATKDELRNNENFRQDLFFRLQVAELRIPDLADRGEDIITLFEYFAAQQCERFGTEYNVTSPKVQSLLLSYEWSGNVRELINVATRYAISGCKEIDTTIGMDEFESVITDQLEAGDSLKDMVQSYEEKLIRSKLTEHGGKVANVLEDLDIERRTFNQKLKRYGISTAEYRQADK